MTARAVGAGRSRAPENGREGGWFWRRDIVSAPTCWPASACEHSLGASLLGPLPTPGPQFGARLLSSLFRAPALSVHVGVLSFPGLRGGGGLCSDQRVFLGLEPFRAWHPKSLRAAGGGTSPCVWRVWLSRPGPGRLDGTRLGQGSHRPPLKLSGSDSRCRPPAPLPPPLGPAGAVRAPRAHAVSCSRWEGRAHTRGAACLRAPCSVWGTHSGGPGGSASAGVSGAPLQMKGRMRPLQGSGGRDSWVRLRLRGWVGPCIRRALVGDGLAQA